MQLEFYFGDVNLSRDRFLRSEIEGSEDGFVEITVLQTFNKLKATGATEEEIAIAATKSELLGTSLNAEYANCSQPIPG